MEKKEFFKILLITLVSFLFVSVFSNDSSYRKDDYTIKTEVDVTNLNNGYTILMKALKLKDNHYLLTDGQGEVMLCLGVNYIDGQNYYVEFNENHDLMGLIKTEDDFETPMSDYFIESEIDHAIGYYNL